MNFLGFITLLLVLGIPAVYGYKYYQLLKYKRKAIDALPDDEPPMDEVQIVDFNGHDIYLRADEMDVWDALTRKQKRFIVQEQKRKLKSGKYVRTPDGMIITKAEAREKGLI